METRKWRIVVSLCALCASVAIPLSATTVTGTIQRPDGTPLNGTIEFVLSQQAKTITPPILFAPVRTTCSVTSGVIVSGCTVVGNDVLDPAGTFYTVRVVDTNNRVVVPATNYTIAGSSVDLGALPVTATATLVPPTGNVVGNLSVTGNLTVAGSANFSGEDLVTSQLRLLGLTSDPATVSAGSVFHRSDLNRLRLRVQGLQLFDGVQYVDITTSDNSVDISGNLKVGGTTRLGTAADLTCRSTEPSSPGSGDNRFYCLTADRSLYQKDDAGMVTGPLAALNQPQTWAAPQSFTVLNGIRFADQFPGADCGAKIQAAVDDIPQAEGGIVFLPAGVCPVSVPINLNTGVCLVGANQGDGFSSITKGSLLEPTAGFTGSGVVKLTAGAAGVSVLRGACARDLAFNMANVTDKYALEARGLSNSQGIKNVVIYDANGTVLFFDESDTLPGQATEHIQVENVFIYAQDRTGTPPIVIRHMLDSTFRNVLVGSDGNPLGANSVGILLDAPAGAIAANRILFDRVSVAGWDFGVDIRADAAALSAPRAIRFQYATFENNATNLRADSGAGGPFPAFLVLFWNNTEAPNTTKYDIRRASQVFVWDDGAAPGANKILLGADSTDSVVFTPRVQDVNNTGSRNVVWGLDGSGGFVIDTAEGDLRPANLTPERFSAPAGASLPIACVPNKELFVDTDALPAGQQLYLCNAAGDGWNLVGDGGSGSGGYDTVQDEGTPLTQRTTLNFAGAGVSCADDTTKTTCTITGGGSGSQHQIDGVNLTANDPINFQDTATIDFTNPSAGNVQAAVKANSISDSLLRQTAGLSVVGRSANTTGNVADIAAGTDNQVLRRSGTALGFGAVNLASSDAVTGTLAAGNWSPLTTNGDLLYHNGTTSTRLARGAENQCLTSTATTIQWGSCSAGGGSSWSDLTAPAAATVFTSDSTTETIAYNFEAAFTTGVQYLIRQQTGNPTGGTLFQVEAADADPAVAKFRRASDNPLAVYFDAGTTAQQNRALIFQDQGSDQWELNAVSDGTFRFIQSGIATRIRLNPSSSTEVNSGSATANVTFGNSAGTVRAGIIGDADKLCFGNALDVCIERTAASTLSYGGNTATNISLDAEGTGNTLTTISKVVLVAAGCNNATAGPGFDLPTSNAPAPACLGTSPHRFGSLDYSDGATETAVTHFRLPSDWTGSVDVAFLYTGDTSSTNNIRWQVSSACVADSEDLLNPTYNTSSASNSAGPATAGQRRSASFSSVSMSNCAAGETVFWKFERVGGDAGDTYAGLARLLEVELTLRRAQ